MDHTLCPQCGQVSVRVVSDYRGAEESRCSVCNWRAGACFGQLHDSNNVKCSGGVDPTYWSDEGNKRQRCTHYEACQRAMMSARQQIEVKSPPPAFGQGHLPQMPPAPAPMQQYTPVQQGSPLKHPVLPPMPGMMSTPAPVQQAAPNVVSVQQALQARAAQPAQPVQQVLQRPQQQVPQGPMQVYGGYYAGQPQQVPVYMVDPRYAQVPSAVPQNHVQPGAQVPAYLSVPEPYNGNFAPMFINSLMRAGLKGMFSQAANLMDHVPWGAYGPPPNV